MRLMFGSAASALALVIAMPAAAQAAPTLDDILAFPFVSDLTRAENADRIAWIETIKGVRNVWAATAPDFKPHQVTRYRADDGQELSQLTLSPDGKTIVYVRGGDHGANWPSETGFAPDPDGSPREPKVEIYAAPFAGGTPRLLAEGDDPAISVKGQVAFVKGGQLWQVPLAGAAKPAPLAFDRGRARAPAWSRDGSRLAFVSGRRDHGFIAVWSGAGKPLTYLAPSTGSDWKPAWSPDGTQIAFLRRLRTGGVPDSLTEPVPDPFAIVVANAVTGEGRKVWTSPATLDGSVPFSGDGPVLHWLAGDTLGFVALLDGWQHLYTVPAAGGAPRLLTPGKFMVEHVAVSRDRQTLYYAADTGTTPGDDDRRHVFAVDAAGGAPRALTGGTGNEWTPVAAGDGVAVIRADAQRPPTLAWARSGAMQTLREAAPDYPAATLVAPRQVTYAAPGGFTIHGQLFEPAGSGRHPAVVFVHGGPKRQMLLGWHYRPYYANAYAVNQYLASRGFAVLSVNYRLGIGYGRAFEQPDKGGPAGGAEYQDVLAGARWLQQQPGVDPHRIGIWGGSYGGYLTAMALARNSDVFKAGVDLHGVHDWSRTIAEEDKPAERYEDAGWQAALKTAFDASPVASTANWRSPVLLIQGDDDRNVRFNQTIDLANRLARQGVPFEELVFPNEIHDFLLYSSWRKADAATAEFLERQLKP